MAVRVQEADFDHVYEVNLRGPWLAMVAEVAAIRATAGTGAIVNNSSVGFLLAAVAVDFFAAAVFAAVVFFGITAGLRAA